MAVREANAQAPYEKTGLVSRPGDSVRPLADGSVKDSKTASWRSRLGRCACCIHASYRVRSVSDGKGAFLAVTALPLCWDANVIFTSNGAETMRRRVFSRHLF
jgi:hypothetical protein